MSGTTARTTSSADPEATDSGTPGPTMKAIVRDRYGKIVIAVTP